MQVGSSIHNHFLFITSLEPLKMTPSVKLYVYEQTTQLVSLNKNCEKIFFFSYSVCYRLNKYNTNQTVMMNPFREIWPRGGGCPVAKINMPAGTKTWKTAVQLVSYQQLCWRGPVFEAEAQNNELSIPKKYSIQTHKHGLRCQKIPHKKKETFSGPGKFVAGWSTPKLLSTITQHVWILWKIPWRKVNLITRPFLSALIVHGMCFF